MKKYALLVGINYEGTPHELNGCINDSHNMYTFLHAAGFDNIELLLEKAATTDNIIASLKWLTTDLVPGDVIVFHYSGHGSQLPSATESDGFEEIICPVDLDWKTKVITDDTLRTIFNAVPVGVNTTVILDCCHSGTMLDQSESLVLVGSTLAQKDVDNTAASRYLPPPARIAKKLKDRSLVDWSTAKDVNESALLIAGCHANQTSADAIIDGQPQGAATAALLKILKADNNVSYRTLVTEMNDYMVENGYSQRPALDGSSLLYDHIFIQPYSLSLLEDAEPNEEPTAVSNSSKFDLECMLKTLVIVVSIFVILTYIFLPH